MTNAIAYLDESTVSGWERSLYASLPRSTDAQDRSGQWTPTRACSRSSSSASARRLTRVTSQDVFAWSYGVGLSGKEPSAITIGARLACLSSFYRFLIRMKVLAANPCDAIERPRGSPSPAKGLDAGAIRRLLAVIPDTPVGLRDRAIILTLVLTGRRRAEVLGMKAGDLNFEGSTCFYSYRGKGGKTGRRELPRPALQAVEAWLASVGKDLTALTPEESLWPDTKNGRGITSGTFYSNLRKYLLKAGLPLAGVHIFRHSAAKLRRDAGESIEDVSRFFDHSSLAVTTTYLRRLEGQEDRGWAKVAAAIGL
jgi:integrase/recombinase XerC